MDDEAALLSAIAAHPAEDTPRLAYADYLDEHGHPIRAEFIRVQCAIKPLEDAPTAVQYEHIHLWKRQQELLEHYRRDLIGPLADAVHERDVVFDRGFVTELRLTAEQFVNHAEAVAAIKPLPDVVAVTDGAVWMPRLVDTGRTGVITSLHMQSERRPEPVVMGEGDPAWRIIDGEKGWERLRELYLEGCGIEDGGLVSFLLADQRFPALTHWDLSHNGISDDGVAELTTDPLFRQLTSLVLGANPISDEGARLLAAAPGKLQYLNLKFTGITREGQQALLRRKGTKVDLF